MKESAGQVLALDEHSISLLRLGVYLHSFTHALNSLLAISIRSSADTISSSIDPATGTICVDDNGVGLDTRMTHWSPSPTPTGQQLDRESPRTFPSVNTMYWTLWHISRCLTCVLEGQVIFSAPARTSRRHNHGTTTTVRDLFHNLTVRQYARKILPDSKQRLKRQWEESRLALQSLAIVYPNITFILRNSSNQNLASLNSSDSSYRLSKTGLSSSTFGKIFQQFVQDSIPLDISIDGFRVTGLFSKKRHSSRAIQLIYLDRVLIESNSSIHKSLASLFAGLLSQDAGGSSATCISLPARPNSISKSGLLRLTDTPSTCYSSHPFLTLTLPITILKIASRVFSQVFPQVKGVIPVSHEKKLHKDNLVKRTLQSRWPVSKRSCLSSPNVINRSHGTPSTSLADRFSNPLKKHVDRPSTKSVHQKAFACKKPPSLQNKIPDLKSRFEYKSLGLSTDRTSAKADQKGHSPSQTISFTHKNEGAEFRIDLSQLANLSKFTEDGLIVAFDQHAVHERIRIERFLQEVCSGNFNVKELKTETEHQRDEVQSQEGPVGFIYELTPDPSNSKDYHPEGKEEEEEEEGFKQILMRAVPELIWQRVQCNDEQFDFLKSILRGCLGFFEDRSRDQNLSLRDHQAIIGDPDRDWFGESYIMKTWAKEEYLLTSGDSYFVTGSIMFGDKLTNEQRRKLLNDTSTILVVIEKLEYRHLQRRPRHPFARSPSPADGGTTYTAMSSARFHLHPSFKSATKLSKDQSIGNLYSPIDTHACLLHHDKPCKFLMSKCQ
ncbi:hypothetical protein H4Q26_002280 [Puccinia striiformis f. sp. tritici PST-130]|nr:hypothetical protein H4Q26_002280 [Puccinia striiformis f. sp. tritici PST-130]